MLYKMSYIICTRNRLDFLQISLKYLLLNINKDEEIIVIDGDSTDGTKNYLESMYQQGQIHQYISEPDRNQAHAFNKGLFIARGELIKKIIDDDLFCFPSIQACKDYMLQNSSCDLCISDSLETSLVNFQNITEQTRLKQYLNWKSGKSKSFTFGDISMIIRKSSLSYLGIFDTSFTMLDYEFSLRVSYLQASIIYYTGLNAMSIFNPNSVSSSVTKYTLALEGRRANPMYEYAGDEAEISNFSKFKIFIAKFLRQINIWSINPTKENNNNNILSYKLDSIYEFCWQYLNKANMDRQGRFL